MEPHTEPVPRGKTNKNLVRVLAVIVLTVAVIVIAWLLLGRSDNDSAVPVTTATPVAPEIISADALSASAADTGHVVDWAGPIVDTKLEFSQTADGRVYVRYLPAGVKAGDPSTDFLVVATYPFAGAYNVLKKVANGEEVKILDGGIAAVSSGQAQSVHFAFPGTAYQGEVYDPSAKRAFEVATSGAIQPVP
ncbi:MAG: hypothetical protein EXQ81_01885 [Thermoleophilia bacterium]|nr:hypothetical protein [Thermoleophilia bacterium]